MRVNCNISAIVANNKLGKAQTNLDKALERLSSGLKINSAEDDAAGLAIANKLHTQIKGLDRATKNSSDGISVVQTAESALNETENILQRIRELSVQAANGTNNDDDRKAIQAEIDQLTDEIDRIANSTEFNTMSLLDGTLSRRCYSNINDVDIISVTTSVDAAKYDINIVEVGTKATANVDLTLLVGKEGNITLNDATIKIDKNDTLSDISAKFMGMCDIANLSYDSSSNTISTKDYGISQKIEYSSTGGLENVKCVNNIKEGKDAKIQTVTTKDGFKDTATIAVNGNTAVIKDFNGFEMIVELGDKAVTGNVQLEVTDMGTMSVQLGANESQTLEVDIPRIDTHTLGIDNINVCTQKGASSAIEKLDNAINAVSAARSRLGAYQNRLESAVTHLESYKLNMTSAVSTIEDADMAEEMTEYTQQNVILQAATSMLSQANERPQSVLQLLQ